LDVDGSLYQSSLIALKNAEQWILEGDMLRKNDSFGHAMTLYVNGVEGLVHAYHIWLLSIGAITDENKEFIIMFKDHRPKFQTLFGFILGRYFIPIVQNAEDPEIKEAELEKSIEKGFKILAHESSRFSKILFESRNRGLYVDYLGNMKFQFPSEVLEKELEEVIALVSVAHEVVSSYIRNSTEKHRRIIRRAYEELYNQHLPE
jgi:AbiV family abortive infection protein